MPVMKVAVVPHLRLCPRFLHLLHVQQNLLLPSVQHERQRPSQLPSEGRISCRHDLQSELIQVHRLITNSFSFRY